MNITIGLIINRLIAYGNERIREFEKDIPPYYTQNRNLLFGNSNVHGFYALTMHCKGYTMACTNRIATAVLVHASSEFNFKELLIYLVKDGQELGLYEFDGDKVVFRPTTFGTKPDSLLADEAYCNKVEEELKMKETVKIDWEKARMKLRLADEIARCNKVEEKCHELNKQDVNNALRQVGILREELNMKESAKIVLNGGVIFAAPPTIEKIHISGPCTVIIWSDKTKTLVRLQEGEPYDAEKAVYAAIAKKFIGTNKSKSNWLDIIRKKMPDEQHNNAFYGVEKSDVESVTQLLKDNIEEVKKKFEEDTDDKTKANRLTDSESDVSADDCISGD